MICPDCKAKMAKTFMEYDDQSGWYCAWTCKCELTEEEIMEIEEINDLIREPSEKTINQCRKAMGCGVL